MILPHNIDISNVSGVIIIGTGIHQIAESMGVHYENDYENLFPWQSWSLDESVRQVNE